MNVNRRAFLDMLAVSEIGHKMLAMPETENGYRVIVGSTPSKLILMDNYDRHPKRLIDLPKLGIKSTAAGRYQLLGRYADHYLALLNLKDFGPDSQDAIALQQIRERRALDDIDAGRFADAVKKVRNIWASLPGAGYDQHENKLDMLQTAYVAAGGRLA